MKKLIKTSLYLALSLFFVDITPLQAMDFGISGVWTDYNDIVEEEIARKVEAIKQATAELFSALRNDDLKGMTQAIKAGAKLNAEDSDGYTPIHKAVKYQKIAAIKLLIEAGANINKRNKYECKGYTPLHRAVDQDNPKIIELLIKAGADINALDKCSYHVNAEGTYTYYGYTPLHNASSHNKPKAIKALIEAGADINAQNSDGHTPLHRTAIFGNLGAAKLLIKAGADINAQDHIGNTPLHRSIISGQVETTKFLIEAGADINAQNQYGNTALHTAAILGETEATKFLIEAGADINAQNHYGSTSLHKAAECCEKDIIKLLIKADVNANILNNLAKTALQSAKDLETQAYITNVMEFKNATNKLEHLQKLEDLDYSLYMHLALHANDAKATDFILDKLKQDPLCVLTLIAVNKQLPTHLVPYLLYTLKVEEKDLQFLIGKTAATEKAQNLQKLYNKAKTLQNKQFGNALISCQKVMAGIGIDDVGQQVVGFYTN